ncbi:MAG: hypothetical protein AAF184_13215 [Pseudomonadota bacterium]
MSEDGTLDGTRLDADTLDPIIAELDLTEAAALDNLMAWYQDALRKAWRWLRDVTGGDDGWLVGAIQRLDSWLTGLGAPPIDGQMVLDVIGYTTIGLIALAGAIVLWRTYRHYFPPGLPASALDLSGLEGDAYARPLTELPRERWAPALFIHTCMALAKARLLEVRPHQTNRTLVDAASLPAPLRQHLSALADAADRNLFAGWLPDDEELAALQARQAAVLAHVAADVD